MTEKVWLKSQNYVEGLESQNYVDVIYGSPPELKSLMFPRRKATSTTMTSRMTLRAAMETDGFAIPPEFDLVGLWQFTGNGEERAGQINTAIFPPSSFAPELDLTTAANFPSPYHPRVLSPDRSISSRIVGFKKPLPPPVAYHLRLSLGESVKDTANEGGRGRWNGASSFYRS